ncbi:MAG TPA: restriction endonuclease subunit S [Coriobacteriaceae bacterium]|nr:restriction endonuclease subunit S [Coriobacteriaceae bacterium]
MLDLNNRDWAPFKISDLFQPARGTEKNMTSLQIGDVPLISARNCDNGVKAFVSIPNERLHRGHAITLNNDGDGGAGLAYYQPMEFALDTHVTDLRPRDSSGNLSRYAMQFVAASISKQRTLFGHGRSISLKRLNLLRVMLPIDESSNPDWQFMEDYIREREAIQIEHCCEFLMKCTSDIERESNRLRTQLFLLVQKKLGGIPNQPDIRHSLWKAPRIPKPKARKTPIHRSARQQQRYRRFCSR